MPRFMASMAAIFACAALLVAPDTGSSQQRFRLDGGRLDSGAAAAHADDDFRLGDLLEFRLMAEEALVLVKTGDPTAAKKQIRVLGSAWDNAEEQLRPRSPANWATIDKVVDGAIQTLHAGTPYEAASAAALEKLIATLDSTEQK
jgi:hypothetical protein